MISVGHTLLLDLTREAADPERGTFRLQSVHNVQL